MKTDLYVYAKLHLTKDNSYLAIIYKETNRIKNNIVIEIYEYPEYIYSSSPEELYTRALNTIITRYSNIHTIHIVSAGSASNVYTTLYPNIFEHIHIERYPAIYNNHNPNIEDIYDKLTDYLLDEGYY